MGGAIQPLLRYGALRWLPINKWLRPLCADCAADAESELPFEVCYKFLNVSDPFIQGLALFVRVLMPLVNANNSTFASRDMIQHRVSDGRQESRDSNHDAISFDREMCRKRLRPFLAFC